MVCRLNWNPTAYPGENWTKNKKIINPVDKVNSKWYIYKRRKC